MYQDIVPSAANIVIDVTSSSTPGSLQARSMQGC